jgi:hypothetical protein
MKLPPVLLALALLSPALAHTQEKPSPAGDAVRSEVHTYRVLFTLTEMDAGKRVGLQHVSMTANAGSSPATLKIGSRIPIVTGGYSATEAGKSKQYQMTYLDVGLNISTQLREMGYGIEALTKIEQSSMADAPPATPADPIIRQTTLQNTAMLTLGKPLVLGSMDIPGSTRHMDVEVTLERVP